MNRAAPSHTTSSPLRRFGRDWVLGAALPIWLVTTFALTLATVDGNSMNPSLDSGDRVLLYKYARWLCAWGVAGQCPRRGQVIVFKAPAESPYAFETGLFGLRYRPYLVKRVVAVGGDTVAARNGQLLVNGQAVAERYSSGDPLTDFAAVKVPRGAVYVLGDNRVVGESVDSRYFGPVKLPDVAGPLGPRLWPLR